MFVGFVSEEKLTKYVILNNKNVLVSSHGNTLRALSVVLGFHSEASVVDYEIHTGQPIELEWTSLEKRF